MPFEAPMTLRQTINDIVTGKYVLPSIQREFVWEAEQIESLFDSILLDYPIGSFLLWQVPAKQLNDYKFYRFLDRYHELDARHNPPAALASDAGVRAVLDGQQRLTALLIGLTGTYAARLPNKRRSNRAAYPVKHLCLDVLNPAIDDSDLRYRIEFLADEEIKKSREEYWVRVSDMFRDLTSITGVTKLLMCEEIRAAAAVKAEFAAQTLGQLYGCINEKFVINYFLEREGNLDKVLKIFIRTNSGGTKLSYSDLLLSIATAAWTTVDARQEIHGFVDEINSINEELTFDKDFVLKACLVLADISDIKFKVENFSAGNMATIEKRWSAIKEAIRSAVMLVDQFGYNDRSLISSNAVIPIAYYILKRGLGEDHVNKRAYQEDRDTIRRWLATVLLRGTFGSMADTILAALRKVINEKGEKTFPEEAISARLLELNRSLRFSSEEIEALLDVEYGDRRAFLLLSLMYPDFDYSEPFHIDHVYPRANLTERRLVKKGLDVKVAEGIADARDSLANLQLLRGRPNQEKSSTDFDIWLRNKYPKKEARINFLQTNVLPAELEYQYGEFPVFLKRRELMLSEKLQAVLG